MDIQDNPIFQAVVAELARLNMSMPIQIDSEVLNEKAIIFAEELSSWAPETIVAAFREHGRSSRFMPALNEIIDKCRTCSQALEYKRQMEIAALPMPDHLPDEIRNENLRQIAKLNKRLGRSNGMPKTKLTRTEREKRVAILRQQSKQILAGEAA